MRTSFQESVWVLHKPLADAYSIVVTLFEHGWYEAFDGQSRKRRAVVCPVQQVVAHSKLNHSGTQVHE